MSVLYRLFIPLPIYIVIYGDTSLILVHGCVVHLRIAFFHNIIVIAIFMHGQAK